MEITRAASWWPTRRSSSASRCAAATSENLLVWTTTPWTLTSNVGGGGQRRARLRQAARQARRRALLLRRREPEVPAAREAVRGEEGVGRGRAQAQDPRPDLQRARRLRDRGHGQGRRAGRAGLRRPFDELEAQAIAGGFPFTDAKIELAAKHGPPGHRRRSRQPRQPRGGRRRGHGHRPHRARLRRHRPRARARSSACPPSRPWTRRRSFLDGFGSLDGQARHRPTRRSRRSSTTSTRRGCSSHTEQYPHVYPHCWRYRRRAGLPAGGRVVHQHGLARRDQGGRRRDPAGSPTGATSASSTG